MKLLTSKTLKLALFVSVLGAGATMSTAALADNYAPSSDLPKTMQQAEMGQTDAAMKRSIVDIASSNDSFTTLVQAVQAAGFVDTLAGAGSYTVFAPTNEAFSQLPAGAVEYLLRPENRGLLRQVLSYHVLPAEVTSSEIVSGPVEALGGGLALRVTEEGRVIVNNASVINADIQANNGVIHAVNRILLPETLQRTLEARLGVSSLYQ
ncbi:fasciclin domain-containing protein [Lyngbya confervoides]|uniref:Fasciclin domain-containing protein n=1 Tax=Lyngbya confervoides BDU141951 TaxID=1574623 RepID=A0ABD4T6L9_9CYAN|nr:fasciclin domain-containing protein [Lyngbya confervoides]MCM1984411.1 fasciclin domain-containing protein [Lyngbya confervoides BDU141951]